MKAVGVKELKARLSEYLRSVRAGTTILVTDRSEVIAELRPASRRGAVADSVGATLDTLADAGQVTRARVAKGTWQWKPVPLNLPRGAALEALDAIRADRDEG